MVICQALSKPTVCKFPAAFRTHILSPSGNDSSLPNVCRLHVVPSQQTGGSDGNRHLVTKLFVYRARCMRVVPTSRSIEYRNLEYVVDTVASK